MEIELTNKIKIAQRLTREAAALKDYRVTTVQDRRMRELARDWNRGKGYEIASLREIAERYGNVPYFDPNSPNADRKRVWGICAPDGLERSRRLRIVFVAI